MCTGHARTVGTPGIKARGYRRWIHTAAVLFYLKALASALLLSTAAFGAAVEPAENLQKRAQPKGIDVSSYQCDTNWKTVAAKGVSFAYIKATEGTSKRNGVVVASRGMLTSRVRLQEHLFLFPVHWCGQGWAHPRCLPFCPSGFVFWCRSGQVLCV